MKWRTLIVLLQCNDLLGNLRYWYSCGCYFDAAYLNVTGTPPHKTPWQQYPPPSWQCATPQKLSRCTQEKHKKYKVVTQALNWSQSDLRLVGSISGHLIHVGPPTQQTTGHKVSSPNVQVLDSVGDSQRCTYAILVKKTENKMLLVAGLWVLMSVWYSKNIT